MTKFRRGDLVVCIRGTSARVGPRTGGVYRVGSVGGDGFISIAGQGDFLQWAPDRFSHQSTSHLFAGLHGECERHPKYKAIRSPSVHCDVCWAIYNSRWGLRHDNRTPRSQQ